MVERVKARHKFKSNGTVDGRVNNGRPKGSPNKTPRFLIDTIMEAGTAFGADGKGKNGLKGYLMRLARDEPRAFAMLLSKIIPTQIKAATSTPREIVDALTVQDAAREYADMIALMRSDPSLRMIAGPNVIEGEAVEQ